MELQAWKGLACRCEVSLELAWRGIAGEAASGMAGRAATWHGIAGTASKGTTRQGSSGHGIAGKAPRAKARTTWRGVAGRRIAGKALLDQDRVGASWPGSAWQAG